MYRPWEPHRGRFPLLNLIGTCGRYPVETKHLGPIADLVMGITV